MSAAHVTISYKGVPWKAEMTQSQSYKRSPAAETLNTGSDIAGEGMMCEASPAATDVKHAACKRMVNEPAALQ
jgi:hypothetical protein